MTETDTLMTNMMVQTRRDTTYPRPFVGTLFQDLMERSGTELGTRGMHRFTDAHMLYVLCLCGSGRISRQELAERTGVGEGAVRNMLSCLRKSPYALMSSFLRNVLLIYLYALSSAHTMEWIYWSLCIGEIIGGTFMMALAQWQFRLKYRKMTSGAAPA